MGRCRLGVIAYVYIWYLTGALLWPPPPPEGHPAWFVSYGCLSPQFQASLSAAALGMYFFGYHTYCTYIDIPISLHSLFIYLFIYCIGIPYNKQRLRLPSPPAPPQGFPRVLGDGWICCHAEFHPPRLLATICYLKADLRSVRKWLLIPLPGFSQDTTFQSYTKLLFTDSLWY